MVLLLPDPKVDPPGMANERCERFVAVLRLPDPKVDPPGMAIERCERFVAGNLETPEAPVLPELAPVHATRCWRTNPELAQVPLVDDAVAAAAVDELLGGSSEKLAGGAMEVVAGDPVGEVMEDDHCQGPAALLRQRRHWRCELA